MARSTAVIQKQILDYARINYGTNPPDIFYSIFFDGSGNPITPSTTNKFVLFTFIVAIAINIFEQLLDLFKTNTEAQVNLAAPGTPQWLQRQVMNFQYSATTPQIVQLDETNFSINYPNVNPALRIITQCAIVTTALRMVLIKVAQGGASPIPLTSPQLTALQSYCTQIDFAGVGFTIRSVDADFLMLGADIYYNGQYSASINQAVTEAINNYITNFNVNNFNGITSLSTLEDILQAVPGVNDVVLKQVEARAFNVIPANAVKLVDNYTELIRNYKTFSGYVIIDTAAGRTLADSLNFIVS